MGACPIVTLVDRGFSQGYKILDDKKRCHSRMTKKKL